MGEHRSETPDQLSAADRGAILDLVSRTTSADGASPISEHVLMHVRHGSGDVDTGGRHVMLRNGDQLTGYAHLEGGPGAEIAEVALSEPEYARTLVDEILDLGGGGIRIWARGESSALNSVLPGLGFEPVRVLVQMRRGLDQPLPDPAWPRDVTVRTFVVGQDEAAWLAVNNAAFAQHPDQSGWTLDDVEQREREPWFDPAGFFLAEDGDELLGFHWTKVHQPRRADGQPVGEVYVVGVAPAAQGRKLGAALTLVGLHHLRDQGLPVVKLYVEADNTPAVSLYDRLGFTRWNADTCYQRRAEST